MRDPDRIKPLLKSIEEVWSEHPDLRLGQLLVILAGKQDIFNIEDHEIKQRIHEWQLDVHTGQ